MYRALIKTGHGYEQGQYGRCDAFDGYEVIAAPLHQDGDGWLAAFGPKARESRIFRRADGNGTDYSSHALKLARNADGYSKRLYLLVHHGSGREVWEIPQFFDGGDLESYIVAMPERLQYGLLFTLYRLASNARMEAQEKTRGEWAQAFADGRLRKKRASKSRPARVEIVPVKLNEAAE